MKKQSKVLEAAIRRLMDVEEVNSEYMDADDLGALKTTIKDLVRIKHEFESTEYKEQLKSFVDYLGSGGTTDEDFDTFICVDYTITHGDHTVTVCNNADFCEGLYILLKEEIDNAM